MEMISVRSMIWAIPTVASMNASMRVKARIRFMTNAFPRTFGAMIASGRFLLPLEQGEAMIFHRTSLIRVDLGIDRKRDLIQDYHTTRMRPN